MKIEITVTVVSPLHLGAGTADINVDADIVHDEYGLPYFPGRRFKGLLYESVVEVQEMAFRSGLEILQRPAVEMLFRHGENANLQFFVPNLYLKMGDTSYQELSQAWKYLEKKYGNLLTPQDVLQSFTSLRYQTKLEDGVAAKGSLHNMRVLEPGIQFSGCVEIQGENSRQYLPLLAAAVRNLRTAGLKRTRGFGRIACDLQIQDGQEAGKTAKDILQEVLG